MSTIPSVNFDWDVIYREGTPPWETGIPSSELQRVFEEGLVPRGTALEIGCGTGCDAIVMVRQGMEVTAVDNAPTAIERARVRAEQEDSLPRFVLGDIFEFAQTAGQFDFVYDAGFYHYIRMTQLDKYLDVLWRVTKPGSLFLTLAGAPGETSPGSPPQVTKRQLNNELGRLFEVVRLDQFRWPSPASPSGFPAWSCFMKRPELK